MLPLLSPTLGDLEKAPALDMAQNGPLQPPGEWPSKWKIFLPLSFYFFNSHLKKKKQLFFKNV